MRAAGEVFVGSMRLVSSCRCGGDMSPGGPPQFLASATTLLLALSSLRSSSQGVPPTVVGAGGWEGSVYTGLYTGPYFDTAAAPPPHNHHPQQQQQQESRSSPSSSATSNNVTAQLGSHAFLPCRVKQLGNKSVSWIRKRDSHILTVDRYTFIADERFGVLHSGGDLWTLQIKYVQSRDAGVYECQVTTEPKMSLMVTLDVIVPQTKILGETDVFVKSGSSVVVKCVITDSLEQPDYIFWFHDGGRVVSVPNSNTYQVVERLSSDTTLGMLVIKAADRRDSGNYTCAPSNLEPASVVLHVLNGETQAGLHQGDQQQKSHNSPPAQSSSSSLKTLLLRSTSSSSSSLLLSWGLAVVVVNSWRSSSSSVVLS